MMMRCTEKRESQDQQEEEEEEEEERDWAEIPTAALSVIFNKLGALEVLMSAQAVCRPWRRLSLDPSLHIWRSIDMRHGRRRRGFMPAVKRQKLAMIAIDRSGGQVEELHARFVDNDFLIYITDKTPKLRCFALILSFFISPQSLTHFLYRCPLLEELHIYCCSLSDEIYGDIAQACPGLRRLWVDTKYASDSDRDSDSDADSDSEAEYERHKKANFWWSGVQASNLRFFSRETETAPAPTPASYISPGDTLAMEIAKTMPQRIVRNFSMTNRGVHAILDKCLNLETLDIHRCFDVRVDDTLRADLSKIKSVRLSRRSQISLADELACPSESSDPPPP